MSHVGLAHLAPLLGSGAITDRGTPAEIGEFVRQLWQAAPHLWERARGLHPEEHLSWRLAEGIATAVRIGAALQDGEMRRVTAALDREGLRHAWMKGAAVRCWTGLGRAGRDLDVATDPSSVRRVERVLVELGYAAAEWSPDRRMFTRPDWARRREVEAQHHELGFLVRPVAVDGLRAEDQAAVRAQLGRCSALWSERDGQLVYTFVCDVHHGLSLDVPTSGLLASATRLRGVPVPSLAWCLALVVYKLYWEGVATYTRGAYLYADVCALLARSDVATHAEAARLLRGMGMSVGAAYVLRRVPALGVPLSAPLEELVEHARVAPAGGDPDRVNDRGDHWPRIWGQRWV